LAEKQPPLFEIASLRVIFLIPVRDAPTLKEPSKWSKEFNAFLARVLVKDPAKRPNADELVNDPFVVKGRKGARQVLTQLVKDTLPTLQKKRAERRTKDEEGGTGATGGTSKGGTFISVNTATGKFTTNFNYGTAVIVDTDESDASNSGYGTTKLNNAKS